MILNEEHQRLRIIFEHFGLFQIRHNPGIFIIFPGCNFVLGILKLTDTFIDVRLLKNNLFHFQSHISINYSLRNIKDGN